MTVAVLQSLEAGWMVAEGILARADRRRTTEVPWRVLWGKLWTLIIVDADLVCHSGSFVLFNLIHIYHALTPQMDGYGWFVCILTPQQTTDCLVFSRLVVPPCSGNSMTTTLRNVRRLGEMSAEKVCLGERDGRGMVQNSGPQRSRFASKMFEGIMEINEII